MKSIWIARDENGDTWMFENKPKRSHSSGGWDPGKGDYMELLFDDYDWFPEVTWESGPVELVPTILLEGMSLEEYIKDLKEKLDIIELRKYVGAAVDDAKNINE